MPGFQLEAACWRVLLVCREPAVAWSPWVLLAGLLRPGQAVLTRMGGFFTKAALLTFGGAYAVLPYVYQGAVEHFQLAHRHTR